MWVSLCTTFAGFYFKSQTMVNGHIANGIHLRQQQSMWNGSPLQRRRCAVQNTSICCCTAAPPPLASQASNSAQILRNGRSPAD